MYKRVLLKLSGEQFSGSKEFGLDTDFLERLARELNDVQLATGAELVIVVGGGNFIRGKAIAGDSIERATADYMGMLATIINGMALVDVLEYLGQAARLQTRLRLDSVAEPYIRRRAIRHLEKGRIVIIAGGTGNPFVTTDTAAVATALELDCEVVLKATKVDGVYSQDPAKHAGATKFTELSYDEALQNNHIQVMDNSALAMAMDNKLPLIIFDLLTEHNIKRVVSGENIGTKITVKGV